MDRRSVLIAVGALGTSGCLRLTDQSDAQGAGDGGAAGGDSPVYSTREEAIDYAGSFAAADAPPLGPTPDVGPERIAFATGSGGGSSSGGADDVVVQAEDIDIVPANDETVRFGGAGDRALRVRNLATESALTFSPDADTESVACDRIKVDTRGDGTLREDTPTLYQPEGDVVEATGTWRGDDELFQHQTFARYVVELLEENSVIGRTGAKVFGNGYRWAVDQTRSTAFITRQPGVREEWAAEFRLGTDPVDPVARTTPRHLPDQGVFEVDLGALDAPADEYRWELQLSEPGSEGRLDRIIELGSPLGGSVIVG